MPDNNDGGMLDLDSTVLDSEKGPLERVVRRSGTLNELESGTHHVRLDCVSQRCESHAAPIQTISSATPFSKPDKAEMYTLAQAFFIVAGGLAIQTKSFHKEPYLTVTPTGALELAKLGLLSPISEEVINDKTKADPITKMLVCIQAGWFIVQCIARVAQKLPLTLLEINTLAHVLIALLMYLFWLPKPYNALSPVLITDPKVIETAALFTLDGEKWKEKVMQARCVLRDGFDRASLPVNEESHPPNDKPSSLPPKGSEFVQTSNPQSKGGGDMPSANERAIESSLPSRASKDNDASGKLVQPEAHHHEASKALALSLSTHHSLSEEPRVVFNVPASERGPSSTKAHKRDQGPGASQSLQIHNSVLKQQLKESLPSNAHAFNGDIDNRVDTTLTLAHLAVQRLKSNKVHFVYFEEDPGGPIEHRSTYFVPSIADFYETPGCDLSATDLRARNEHSRFHFMYAVLPSQPISSWVLILSTSYGAFHLVAWNAHFSTTIERWMWRASGLTTIGPLSLFISGCWPEYADNERTIVTTAATKVIPQSSRSWPVFIPYIIIIYFGLLLVGLLLGLFVVSTIATFPSRLYFVVEALISLREPAPRTYETVEWTQFWPHG